MVKNYGDRSKWKAPNEEKRLQILKVLSDKNRKFNDILERLNELPRTPDKKKWNRTTLTVYLWLMTNEGWIKHSSRGAPYSINKANSAAMSLLNSRILFKGRTNLKELNEKQFISDWRASLDFAFFNIVKNYVLLGRAKIRRAPQEKILQITQASINDMVYLVAEYGSVMVKQITNNEMKEKQIFEALETLQKG